MQLDREVTVGVEYGPSRDEGGRLEPRFFHQLPARGLLGALARFDLSSRELPEAREESGRGPLLDEPAVAVGEHDDRRPYVGASGMARSNGDRSRVLELEMGPAGERDRAPTALRSHRPADRLAELHHRLVELTGAPGRHEPGEHALEVGSNGPLADIALFPGPAGRDPEAVRLECELRTTERDGGDGPGDVRSDPGQGLELGDAPGQVAPVLLDEASGGGMEVVSPGVVAGPFPDLEDPFDRCPGERLDVGEGSYEPFEVRGRLVDASLLQQHLGDPDPVRVPVGAPGKRSTVPTIPPKEFFREPRRGWGGGRGSGTHGFPTPDEDEA